MCTPRRAHNIGFIGSNSRGPASKRNMLLDDIDPEVSTILRKLPFSSVATSTDTEGSPASTIYSPLVEKIGFEILLLCWLPYSLTDELHP
jgi:hypothetical protein